MNIRIPYNFEPRNYQLPFFKVMDKGCKRAVLVWHRRAGKDKCALNLMIKKMLERKGIYYYFFPRYSQARKVIWEGIDSSGMSFLDHFPKSLIVNKNDTEMKIRLRNGSLFQLIGTDNIDAIMGTNPVGCVFSEYALQDPLAWSYVRPILAENDGWAVFVFTPRGMNHGWEILQTAKKSENWFWQILTVDDTKAISKEKLEEEKSEMPEALFEQEYYCKFLEGANQVFKGFESCIYDGDLEPKPNHQYVIGVDLAKSYDYTVITPFDLHSWKAGMPIRISQIDYNKQKKLIIETAEKFNNALVRIDSTGLGEPIYDDLVAAGLNVEPFKITGGSTGTRKKLLENLRIKIPKFEPLIDELRSFQYELLPSGETKISVPSGCHDDCVFSLALAVWGLANLEPYPEPTKENPYPSPIIMPRFTKY